MIYYKKNKKVVGSENKKVMELNPETCILTIEIRTKMMNFKFCKTFWAVYCLHNYRLRITITFEKALNEMSSGRNIKKQLNKG